MGLCHARYTAETEKKGSAGAQMPEYGACVYVLVFSADSLLFWTFVPVRSSNARVPSLCLCAGFFFADSPLFWTFVPRKV
jgi:hypothetical protein